MNMLHFTISARKVQGELIMNYQNMSEREQTEFATGLVIDNLTYMEEFLAKLDADWAEKNKFLAVMWSSATEGAANEEIQAGHMAGVRLAKEILREILAGRFGYLYGLFNYLSELGPVWTGIKDDLTSMSEEVYSDDSIETAEEVAARFRSISVMRGQVGELEL